MKKLIIPLAMTAFLTAPMSALAFDLAVRGYYWFPELDGNSKVDTSNLTGTEIDLENDLGMGDEAYPVIEALLGAGNHHLSLSMMNVDYSGSKTLSRSVNFAGNTYPLNTNVDSNLSYSMIDAEYQYDILDLENTLAGFSLGVIGKIKYVNGEIELRSSTNSGSEDFSAPIPMIGAAVHVGLIADILEARLKMTGISYSGDSLYDILADVSFTPFPLVDIHAGYRLMDLNVDEDSTYFDYSMAGPYAALTIGF